MDADFGHPVDGMETPKSLLVELLPRGASPVYRWWAAKISKECVSQQY
jgi:hypothetical protein